ncbi:hypothetical protein [Methanobrevibacter sp.]|uniref:hypothetical protein n=1 Tax=Methanobrevibacter sp. TaxID=66852 RepID=UPI0038657811
MNIFNRKKQEDEPQPNEFETTILEKLDEQLEFNQLLIKKLNTLEKDYKELLQYVTGTLKEYIHSEEEVLHRKITIEARKLNEQLLHMNDINLTSDDIRKFIDIGYEYLQEEYEFEIIPDSEPEADVDVDHKPVTITEVLETIEEDPDSLQPKPKHLIHIAKSLRQPYNLKLINDGRLKSKGGHGKAAKFTIHDIIQLKEKIPEYAENHYTFKEINLHYPKLSDGVVKRLIWNVEEGNFDKLIDEYTASSEEDFEEYELSFDIHNQEKKKYKIKGVYGVDIYRYGQGNQKLNFSMLEVLYIKENLNRWGLEETSRAKASEEAGVSEKQLMRIIYNLKIGTFNKYLKEFEGYGEHKFAIINNTLYIDTEDTGLDLSICRLILHDYTNASDKYRCLKNLIRTHYNHKAYHILLITRYYDDTGFRNLILHENGDSVTVVNNPEKRRDYGTNLIRR